MSIQKQEKAQTRRQMFFNGRRTLLEQGTSQLYWSRAPPNFTGAGHLPTLLEQGSSQLYWSRTPPDFTGAGHLPTLLEQDTSQLYWSRTPPNFVRARRENIIVLLPGCVDEAKMQIPHMMLFSFLFLMIFSTLYLYTPIKKINDYLFNFTGKVQKWMRPASLNELRTVIGLLFLHLHTNTQSHCIKWMGQEY
jgi:hypothetical protein